MIALGLALLGAAGSVQAASDCPEGTRLVEERRVETETAIYIQPICEPVESPDTDEDEVHPPLYAKGFTTEDDFIDAAIQFARAGAWSQAEIDRLSKALDGTRGFETVDNKARNRSVWAAIEKRAADPLLAQAAAQGDGAELLLSGWQSGQFADCAIFAIATATGAPYGVIAARANELVKSASWRSAFYRNDPQQAFSERGGGLNDYEIALLGEAFGQISAVEPSEYAATVRSGRAILLPVATAGGSAHEVVLARTFRHDGSDWFEILDSTRSEPEKKLYLSASDLRTIALAKGLTVKGNWPDAVPLLRDP